MARAAPNAVSFAAFPPPPPHWKLFDPHGQNVVVPRPNPPSGPAHVFGEPHTLEPAPPPLDDDEWLLGRDVELKEGLLKLHKTLRDQSVTLLRCLVHNPGEHEKHRRPLTMLIKNIAGLLHRARAREARVLVVQQAKAQLARKLEFRKEAASLLPKLEARLADLIGEDMSEILPLSEEDPTEEELAEWAKLAPEDEELIAELSRLDSAAEPDASDISAEQLPAATTVAAPNEAEMLSAAEQIGVEFSAGYRNKSQAELADERADLAPLVVAATERVSAAPLDSPKKAAPRTSPLAEPAQRPPPRPPSDGGVGRGAGGASKPPSRVPPRPPAPPPAAATNGASEIPIRTSPRKPVPRQLATEQQAMQGSPPSSRTRAAEPPRVQRAGPETGSAGVPDENGGPGGKLVLKIRRRTSETGPAVGEDPSKKRRV